MMGNINENISVSVVIVTYNNCKMLDDCVSSIIKHTQEVDYEIIVVDNASEDGTVQMIRHKYPTVRLIESEINLGFGKANNLGVSYAKGKFILYLNSDTLFLNNAIKCFYDYWDEHDDSENLGAIGGLLLDINGNIIHSGGSFPNPKSILYYRIKKAMVHTLRMWVKNFGWEKAFEWLFNPKVKVTHESGTIDYVIGADLFLKNNQNALFDPEYFIYYDESDIQLKMHNEGYVMKLIEGPKIVHLCDGGNPDYKVAKMGLIYSDMSSLYYLKKNFNKNSNFLRWIILLDWKNKYIKPLTRGYEI